MAGICIALAASAKTNNVLLFLPVFLALWARFGRDLPGYHLKNILSLFSIFLSCLLIFNPYYLLAPNDLWYSFFREIIFGNNYPNDTIRYLSGWWFQLSYSLWFGLGFSLYLIGFIGFLPCFYKNKKMFFIFILFPFLFFLLSGSIARHVARYSLALLPFFCITAGMAVSLFYEKIKKYLPDKKIAFLSIALFTILISIPSIIQTIDLDIFFARKHNSAIVRDYIVQNIPQGSAIACNNIAWKYSRVTGLTNYHESKYSPGTPADYVIVYYDFGMNNEEINSIQSNYHLEKAFIISKKKGMTYCDNESFHYYRTDFFERPRCDIELYAKKTSDH